MQVHPASIPLKVKVFSSIENSNYSAYAPNSGQEASSSPSSSSGVTSPARETEGPFRRRRKFAALVPYFNQPSSDPNFLERVLQEKVSEGIA